MRLSPIEKTLTYATTVDTLPEAWTFVMEHIDSVGSRPTIHILPMWRFHEDGTDDSCYEVSVSGMTEEK